MNNSSQNRYKISKFPLPTIKIYIIAAKRAPAITNASPASPTPAKTLEGEDFFLESPRLLAPCAGSRAEVAAPVLNRGIAFYVLKTYYGD
jgi:hypothetical protein